MPSTVIMRQAFLKKEQERKEAELWAEKQEALRKRKEEKRIAREVRSMYWLQSQDWSISYFSLQCQYIISQIRKENR